MEPLTTKQAGELLGISARRVLAMIGQGKLKARKFANVYMILKKDVEAARRAKGPIISQGQTGFSLSEPHGTIMDIAPHIVGSVKGGPPDLSTNKKYLDGFGTKKGERNGKRRKPERDK